MNIRLKTEKDIAILRVSGKILSNLLYILKEHAHEGVSLSELDSIAEKFLKENGVTSAFFGYRPEKNSEPYPAHICASVNNIVVHGVPSRYVLKDGDILKIDAGVNYNEYITDAAFTVGIGEISEKAKELIVVTRHALQTAIGAAIVGNTIGDIGWTIDKTITSAGFHTVRGLIGHGVGFKLHEDPSVYNYGDKGKGMKLKSGLVLAIEPIVGMESGNIKQLPDDSFAIVDGSISAHFEQTIVITDNGTEILTPFLWEQDK